MYANWRIQCMHRGFERRKSEREREQYAVNHNIIGLGGSNCRIAPG